MITTSLTLRTIRVRSCISHGYSERPIVAKSGGEITLKHETREVVNENLYTKEYALLTLEQTHLQIHHPKYFLHPSRRLKGRLFGS